MISLLFSLTCGWPLGVNGFLFFIWQRLLELRVEGSLGARKGGPNRPPEWASSAGLCRPAQAHPGPVQFGRPFTPVGPHVFMHFAPLHLHYFDDVILASKSEVLLA
jgi:hypothetical protein